MCSLSCAPTCWKRLILRIETHWWLPIRQPWHCASWLMMQEIRRHTNSIWNPSARAQHKILQRQRSSKKDQHALGIHEWMKSMKGLQSPQEEAWDATWAAQPPSLPPGIKKMCALPQARENRIELQHSQLRGKTFHPHCYTTLRLLRKTQGSALWPGGVDTVGP